MVSSSDARSGKRRSRSIRERIASLRRRRRGRRGPATSPSIETQARSPSACRRSRSSRSRSRRRLRLPSLRSPRHQAREAATDSASRGSSSWAQACSASARAASSASSRSRATTTASATIARVRSATRKENHRPTPRASSVRSRPWCSRHPASSCRVVGDGADRGSRAYIAEDAGPPRSRAHRAAGSAYRLLLRVASGGMASVYVGFRRADASQELVAIKRSHPHLLDNPTFAKALATEAHLLARMHHSNVVGIRELEECDDDLLLVMDYVEGASLSGLLKLGANAGKPMPAPIAVRIVLDACAGLAEAHELTDAHGSPAGSSIATYRRRIFWYASMASRGWRISELPSSRLRMRRRRTPGF